MRLVAGFHQSPNDANNQRHLHPGLQSLASDVAQQNQYATASIRKDLEEVTAYLLCGPVFGFQHVPGHGGDRFRYEELLNLPCLIDFSFPLLAQSERLEEAPHQEHSDDVERNHDGNLADIQCHAKWEEHQR